MALYELTQSADEDFEKLFDFGIDTFGLAQAIDYQQGMKKRFEELQITRNCMSLLTISASDIAAAFTILISFSIG